MATFRPSVDHLDQLLDPLDPAEVMVLDALRELPDDWTVYVKARLGLDIADFLAVHPHAGVCAITVRGWRPGEHRLVDGTLEHRDADEAWTGSTDSPRADAARLRATVHDQFFALPSDGTEATETVRAVVVVPTLSNQEVVDLLAHPLVPPDERKVAVWGAEGVAEHLDRVLRGQGCAHPRPASLTRLHQHVVASEIPDPRPEPVPLGADVRLVAANPSGSRVRRVRGSAGSGKTFAVAARAARLAERGADVLVLSFSVTLANHLRRSTTERCHELGTNPTRISCANFHSFCTRIVQDAERAGVATSAPERASWPDAIVAKATQALAAGASRRYDAVLIDEGQDFTRDWWDLLRHHVVTPEGELLIVTDPTQDLYDRTGWTDDVSIESGFGGPWIELTGSYRMPTDLLPLANDFGALLPGDHVLGRVPDDLVDTVGPAAPTTRHWRNVERVPDLGVEIGREVVRILRTHPSLAPRDVVFLCEYHHDGVAAVAEIEAAGHPVHHIFSRNPDDARRRRKYRFWPEADSVKGTTIHSFKGWESPVVVLGIALEARSRRQAYLGLTRVRAVRPGEVSVLSVLNADRRLDHLRASFEAWAPPPSTARIG